MRSKIWLLLFVGAMQACSVQESPPPAHLMGPAPTRSLQVPRAARSAATGATAGAGIPPADLCGTWVNIELSVTTPNPASQTGAGNGKDSLTTTHTFCRTVSVAVPTSIEALGDPGNNDASLTFQVSGTSSPSIPSLVTCKYHGDSAASAYDFVSCDKGVKSGALIGAQTFGLEVDFHDRSPTSVARVTLSGGTSPPPAAYTEYLGTTPSLAGVVLHVPAGSVAPFSGVGLAEGPPYGGDTPTGPGVHPFVANPPDGLLLVGPSVQVTGTGTFPPGVTLTVPFDSAWISTLPAGTADTLQLQQVLQTQGSLAAVDVTPLSGTVDPNAATITAGLPSPSQFVTTIRDLTPLTNHGGPLMNSGLNVYIVWAGNFDAMAPADDPRPAVRQFLADLPTSSWYQIASTYGITNQTVTLKTEVPQSSLTTVSDAYSDAIQPLLGTSLPIDPGGLYFVIGASGVKMPSGFCHGACAKHFTTTQFSYGGSNTATLKYAWIGSPVDCGSCKVWPETYGYSPPNGGAVDGVLTNLAHEIVETVTDPELSAWYGAGLVENADKCAWVFHSVQTDSTSAVEYDMTSNGHRYYIQSNWVNAAEGGYCAMGIESVQMGASPQGAVYVDQVGTFTVTVTNVGPVLMDAGEFEIVAAAVGANVSDSVPVPIGTSLAPGQTVNVEVPVQAPSAISGTFQWVPFTFELRDPSNLHTFPTTAEAGLLVYSGPGLTDQAECDGVTMPATVTPGETFPVTMTFKNTGMTVWQAGQYQLVGLPTDFINPYLQTPQVLNANISPGDPPTTLTFSATAPAISNLAQGGTFNVTASMANAAAAFPASCSSSTQLVGYCTPGTTQPCGSGLQGCTATCQANGTWACPPNTTLCGDSCVDTMVDSNNCGACGNPCSVIDSFCYGGACTCNESFIVCPGPNGPACVGVGGDPNNCAGCGDVCPSGYVCSEFKCVTPACVLGC